MDATELAGPWLAVALGAPLAGALAVRRHARGESARPRAVAFAALALLASLGAAVDHGGAAGATRSDPFDPGLLLFGRPLFGLDELSAWLLPFGALAFAAAFTVAPRRALGAGLASRLLLLEGLLLATFACGRPAGVAVLFALSIAPVAFELRAEGGRLAARVFERYMLLSVCLLGVGVLVLELAPPGSPRLRALGAAAVLGAVAVRQGIVPFHSWVPEVFAGAPLGAALLQGVAQVGAYALVRIAAPDAPAGLSLALTAAALATAVYGASAALVQEDPRRSFACVFMSQSALVASGLGSGSPIGVAGALALWISSGLALGGFGMTLWVLEARRGPLSLRRFHGGYERMPLVATCFLVFGLASVGFPGTLGFVGEELLLHGFVETRPGAGLLVAIATALNGVAVVRMYFHLFCGARDPVPLSQRIRPREALGFATLAALLVLGGLAPAPFIDSRARAAGDLLGGGSGPHAAVAPAHAAGDPGPVDSPHGAVVQSARRIRGAR